jgi:hypothetical protein
MFRAAEVKAGHLKQSNEGHTAESKKLVERLAAAQEQYMAGLAKVKATHGQLQSLSSRVSFHLAEIASSFRISRGKRSDTDTGIRGSLLDGEGEHALVGIS